MRKSIIAIVAIAAAFASCTKSEIETPAQEAISFQTANYVTKSASYANGPFGVCAWYKGAVSTDNVDYFMDYQKVTGVDGSEALWHPTVPSSWPKTGSINFVAYSPFSEKTDNKVVITENTFDFKSQQVGAQDLMYSDWAFNQTAATAANGVPILFHHALAKIQFRVKPTYTEVWDNSTKTFTRWEIFVEDAIEIGGILNEGSLSLSLAQGASAWTKPESNVWTATSDNTTSIKLKAPGKITSVTDILEQTDGPLFVLPQAVGTKTLKLQLTIKTYRATGADEASAKAACEALTEPVLIETGVTVNAVISKSSVASWDINTITTYTLGIAPAYTGKVPEYIQDKDHDGVPDKDPEGNPIVTTDPEDAIQIPVDPTDPDSPTVPGYAVDKDGDGKPDVDPDTKEPVITTDPTDPDVLKEEVDEPIRITFDPSVENWTSVEATATELQK